MAFRSFAILSALVAAVLAQSSSNPLIPPGISASCSAYLSALNSNSQIQSCLSPITTALAAFSPSSNTSSCSTSTITSTLGSLCSSSISSNCPQNIISSQLSTFYANCSVELTSSPNLQVKLTYDALYVLQPLRQALCSKDDKGNYCVTNLSNSSTGSTTLTNAKLSRRDGSNTTEVFVPNATTFSNDNVIFFFLQPNMPSSELCTVCTRNVLASYISFESDIPYASGVSQSLLLAGQPSLYNNITNVCGSGFLGGVVGAAGGLSQGILNGAARVGVQEFSATVGAILGVAGLVAASL